MRAPVHVDGAEGVRPADVEDVEPLLVGHLEELDAVGRLELTRHPRRLAAGVRLQLVLLALDEERASPRLPRHLVDLRAKIGAVMPMVGSHTPFSDGVAPISTTRPLELRGGVRGGPA